MALTVTEKWSNPASGVQGNSNGQSTSDATRHWQMVADSVGYTPVSARYEAMAEGYIARVGESHPSDAFLICRAVEVNKTAPFFFEATARYEKLGGDDQDPNVQPAEISFEHVVTEEPIDQDANGNAIITATREAFDPPIQRPVADLFIRVTKNVITFDPLVASTFMYRVNSAPFLGFPAGTLLIEQFSANAVMNDQGAVAYWRRTIGIHVRRGAPNTTDRKAWYRRVRAEGFYISTGPPDPQYYIAGDDNGDPVTKPVLHKVADGTRIDDPDDAEWYEFQIFPEIDFTPLSFI